LVVVLADQAATSAKNKPKALPDSKTNCARAFFDSIDPTRTSIAEIGEHWTKLPMISTLDDIWYIWSKRAASTSIVASLYRLAVPPFHPVQQYARNVARLAIVICVLECRLRG
jgi:hypothetical protein